MFTSGINPFQVIQTNGDAFMVYGQKAMLDNNIKNDWIA